MAQYLLKRLGMTLAVMLLVMLFLAGIVHLIPGDPVENILGPRATAARIAQVQEEMGLHDPVYVQIASFVWTAVQGDLGRDFATNRPVTSMIANALPHTLTLAIAFGRDEKRGTERIGSGGGRAHSMGTSMHAPKLILGSTLLAVLAWAPASAREAQVAVRVAYIDSQAILMEAPGAGEAQAEFDRQMQSFTREIETLEQDLAGVRLHQTRDDVEECRLAGARCAPEENDLLGKPQVLAAEVGFELGPDRLKNDLGVLDLAQPAVDVQQEVVELLVAGPLFEAEVAVHLGGAHQGPDLAPDRGQFGRVHGGDVAVLVQELFQARDVAVALGAGHRRDEVVDDGGVGAAFGLGALAGVVDQERVDERQVAQGGVGGAGGGEGGVLAGQPLQGAVLAQVHDGVGAEAVLQPAVGRQVVVAGGQVGVVVDGDRVLAEAARRLDQHHDVARPQRGQHQLALFVHVQLAGRGAPRLGHRLLKGRVQVPGPFGVLLGGDAHVRLGELDGGQPVLVLAARLDQGVDQGVAGLGLVGQVQAGQGLGVTEVVALLPQAPQQAHQGAGGVQADGVADPRVLGGVGGQHHGDALLRGRHVPEPGVRDGGPGQAGAALGVGDVAGQAVAVDLLEGERHRDDAAVELGDGDLGGRVQRGDPVVGLRPVRARAGQAQALQDGDVQGGHPLHVPGLVVAARARGGGHAAARREDGDDQGVEGAERLVEVVGGRPQRPGEDGDAHGPAGGVHGVGQGVREGGVAARLVGPVVEDAHLGQLRVAGGLPVGEAPRRQGRRGLETLAGEQHGVGEEGVQAGEVGWAALGEVAVGLGGQPDGNGGVLHQLGAGLLLAAEHHQGRAALADRGQAGPQVVRGAQQAHHHEVGALDGGGEFGVGSAGRVGPQVVGSAGPGGQQVGVGRGQQSDPDRHGRAPPSGFSPHRRSDCPRPVSGCTPGGVSQWRNRPGIAPGSCTTSKGFTL